MNRTWTVIASILFMGVVLSLATLPDLSVPNTFTAGTRAVATDMNANFDTIEAYHNRMIDSLRARIETDSIKSTPHCDSLYIDERLFGNATVDSLTISNIVISAGTATFQSATIQGGLIDGNFIGNIVPPTIKAQYLSTDTVKSIDDNGLWLQDNAGNGFKIKDGGIIQRLNVDTIDATFFDTLRATYADVTLFDTLRATYADVTLFDTLRATYADVTLFDTVNMINNGKVGLAGSNSSITFVERTDSAAAQDAIRIDSCSIGVGIYPPTALLDVYRNWNDVTRLYLRNPMAGTYAGAQISAVANGTNNINLYAFPNNYTSEPNLAGRGSLISDADSGLNIISTNTSVKGIIRFMTKGQTTANVRMVIDSGGNIGVGTSAPVNYLAGTMGVVIRKNVNAGICLSTPKKNYLLYTDSTQGKFYIFGGAYPYNCMTIDSNHNMGIDTTTPESKFHVAGSGRFRDTMFATVIVDLTPGFEGDALSGIRKIKSKQGRMDHNSLPAFVRIKKASTIKKGRKTEDVPGRDIGAMVTFLTRAVQQLADKVDSLKLELKKK